MIGLLLWYFAKAASHAIGWSMGFIVALLAIKVLFV